MDDFIYYNPKCSKCRAALALLQSKGAILELRDYLNRPPSVAELKHLCKGLDLRPYALVRIADLSVGDVYPQPEDDEGWITVLSKTPGLLQRPIVGWKGKMVIGRPPEMVLDLF